LDLSGLIVDLQDRIRPLRHRMFPRELLLELHDDMVRGQVLADGAAGKVRFEAPLPALTCRDGMPLEKEPLGDLIGNLLVRDDVLETFLRVSLPAPAVHWRVISWPQGRPLPAEPLAAVRDLDATTLRFPFDLSDALIDAKPVAGKPRLLVAAAPRKLIDAWIEVFAMAGTQLERLAPAQNCEYLALRPLLEQMGSRDLLGLLSAEGRTTRLTLFRDGIPRFQQRLTASGTALANELHRCIAFYRRQDPQARGLRLIQANALPEAQVLAQDLGVVIESPTPEPFDSLILQGLACLGSSEP
jgi:Tfp pilus assembly PilM family ATPase